MPSVRHLGVFLDSDLTMNTHVGHVLRLCFTILRQIKAVVTVSGFKTLATSLVLSRLDYCNSALVGLPKSSTRRLQSVVNAAARLVTRVNKYDHISPILHQLHWLRVNSRIEFKVALMTFKCLNSMAPTYLTSCIQRVQDIPARRRLRSSSSSRLLVPAGRLKSAGDRRFAVAGPRLWNRLPPEVTSATTIESFRKKLKTHLFSGLEVL